MVRQSTRRKKDVWGVRPGARDMRKEWINASLKRLALIDLGTTNIKDETAREEICKIIKGYRELVTDLRNCAVWPDDKITFVVKSSIRRLEVVVAGVQFGLDSPQYHYACERRDEVMKEEMDKEMKKIQEVEAGFYEK
jgi:hypothetical protein